MTKNSNAFMPLYVGDYLADTTLLTRDQHGAYLLLIMAYWRNRGPLPDRDDGLAMASRSAPQEWKKLRPIIETFFEVKDGVWVHKRIDEELHKADVKYAARVEASRKANGVRHGVRHGPSNGDDDGPSNGYRHGSQPHLLPSPSGKGSKKRRAAAQSQPAAPPAASSEGPTDTRWEQAHPKWLKVRQAFGDTLWLSTFGCCRPNGSETSIIAPSKFWAEKLDTQFSDKLERVFGEPVTFKFQEEAKP